MRFIIFRALSTAKGLFLFVVVLYLMYTTVKIVREPAAVRVLVEVAP
jgi:hypothetical protein